MSLRARQTHAAADRDRAEVAEADRKRSAEEAELNESSAFMDDHDNSMDESVKVPRLMEASSSSEASTPPSSPESVAAGKMT